MELHLPWWRLLCDPPSGQRREREGKGKSEDEGRREGGREGRELLVLSQIGLMTSGGLEDIPARVREKVQDDIPERV